MTVKEIVKTAASLLSREDVVGYLSGETDAAGEDTLPTINTLVTLINLVISELAGTYIPMVKREEVNADGGKVYYTSLKDTPLKIKKVFDNYGKEIFFSDNALYIEVNEKNVVVEYEFVPPNYGLDENIGYTEKDVSVGTLAFGLLAEYSICKCAFDEAVMWHKRYVDGVNATRKPKNVTTKKRSWL